MDPPSRERRFELISGGAAVRGLMYAVQRHLHMDWDEWGRKPWWQQAGYVEGLIREKLYDPNDYEADDGDAGLDELAASGYQVGVEHVSS